MKNSLNKVGVIVLMFVIIGPLYAQTDRNGNPVFNSVSTGEQPLGSCLLLSNYYTLRNNLENSGSSVFISENPTLLQIEQAAVNLHSDFFILTKESKMVAMVMLQQSPKREFLTILMSNNKQSTYPCQLKGDITEARANEIVEAGYDSLAYIKKETLFFNNKKFQIINKQDIEAAVVTLVKKHKLDKKEPSNVLLPSKEELKEYVLSETNEGGQLDFFTEIEGHEYDGIQIKPGLFATKLDIALYKWGRACFTLGVNTVEDAYKIFAEHQGQPINPKEREYIKMGFNRELEK